MYIRAIVVLFQFEDILDILLFLYLNCYMNCPKRDWRILYTEQNSLNVIVPRKSPAILSCVNFC